MAQPEQASIAVLYLARGADPDWLRSVQRFVASYKRHAAGSEHRLYVIYKGFGSKSDLARAITLFAGLRAGAIHLPDSGFDIGAYFAATDRIEQDCLCLLNTHSELMGSRWLEKLALHLNRREVGLVGATGSFESLLPLDKRFPKFPNVHLRSNGFMIKRALFREVLGDVVIREKEEAYRVESGPTSLTNAVFARGLKVMIVGRNGRAYSPRWWPASETFRQGDQPNLLIADNQTRAYAQANWHVKRSLAELAWGEYLDPEKCRTLSADIAAQSCVVA